MAHQRKTPKEFWSFQSSRNQFSNGINKNSKIRLHAASFGQVVRDLGRFSKWYLSEFVPNACFFPINICPVARRNIFNWKSKISNLMGLKTWSPHSWAISIITASLFKLTLYESSILSTARQRRSPSGLWSFQSSRNKFSNEIITNLKIRLHAASGGRVVRATQAVSEHDTWWTLCQMHVSSTK